MKFCLGRVLIIFVYIAAFTAADEAYARDSAKEWYVVEATMLGGQGSSAISTDQQSPTIGTFSFGVTVGIRVRKFTLGVSADYGVATQFSDITAAEGNRRGNFYNYFSPTISLDFGRYFIKLDYQNSGQYVLTNSSMAGETVAYSDAQGIRIQFGLSFPSFSKDLDFCVFYQGISYNRSNISGPLSEPIQLSVAGVGIAYDL
jgi:hypothetical protein